MEKWLEKLAALVEKNDLYDPWVDHAPVLEVLETVEEEIQELKLAVTSKDLKNIKEEAGDLIWTAFLVILSLKRKFSIEPLEVVNILEKKMKLRKPYIFDGKKPSLEEAERIWIDAKRSSFEV